MGTTDLPLASDLVLHLDWLRRLASSLVRDEDRARDLEQETWRLALEHPPASRANLRGWLATIATNLARSGSRAAGAREARERAVARAERIAAADELAAEAELSRALVGHVLALDEPYRTTLLLRYFRDLSPAQIAAREGVPANTV